MLNKLSSATLSLFRYSLSLSLLLSLPSSLSPSLSLSPLLSLSLPLSLSAHLPWAAEYTDCFNDYAVYDSKQSDGEVPAMLELWGMRSTSIANTPRCYILTLDRAVNQEMHCLNKLKNSGSVWTLENNIMRCPNGLRQSETGCQRENQLAD